MVKIFGLFAVLFTLQASALTTESAELKIIKFNGSELMAPECSSGSGHCTFQLTVDLKDYVIVGVEGVGKDGGQIVHVMPDQTVAKPSGNNPRGLLQLTVALYNYARISDVNFSLVVAKAK